MSAEVELLGKQPDGSLMVEERQVLRPDVVNKGSSAMDSYVYNDRGSKNLKLDQFKTTCFDIMSSMQFTKWA